MWKMGCMEEIENIEYRWQYATDFFFILYQCVCESNGLLNKNYWNDLDIIYQVRCKGYVSQFC